MPYAVFARKAYYLLKRIKPCIIHVQALDMLKIACAYKKKVDKDVRIIYEVPDLHKLIIDEQKSLLRKIAQKYLRYEDRRCCQLIDLLIVTSEKYVDRYFADIVSRDKVLFIPNVPDLRVFETYKQKARGNPPVVGYIGGIRYKKQIWNLIEAAKECGMKLMLAGFENEPLEIEPYCMEDPNIEWIGRFDFESQIAELYGRCDIMYSVYDADMENVRVALPNKLYEAVYCQMPIIVAKNTYLSEVVAEWSVGVAVNHKDSRELIEVLRRFRDDPNYFDTFEAGYLQHKDEVDIRVFNEKLQQRIFALLN